MQSDVATKEEFHTKRWIGLLIAIFLSVALLSGCLATRMVIDKNKSSLKVQVHIPATLPVETRVFAEDLTLRTMTITVQQGGIVSSKVIDVQKNKSQSVVFENQLPGNWEVRVKAKDINGYDVYTGTGKVSAKANSLASLKVPLKILPGDLFVHFFLDDGADIQSGVVKLTKADSKDDILTSPLYVDQQNRLARASFSKIAAGKWKVNLRLASSTGEEQEVNGGTINILPGRVTTARISEDQKGSIPAKISWNKLPEAPNGLSAMYQEASTILSWNKSKEANVAGYLIYRNGRAGEKLLLTPAPVFTTTYIDGTVSSGKRYQYWVQSVSTDNYFSMLSKPTSLATAYPNLSREIFSALNAARPLSIPTYENSGQAIHPDVLFFPTKWKGYHYWMAFTPYPSTAERYENPSIVVSNDGQNWQVPKGLQNPVFQKPARGHYSDTNLCLGLDKKLYLFFRERHRLGLWLDYDEILVSSSADGIHWSHPKSVTASLHGFANVLSPSVLTVGNKYYMYTVSRDAGSIIQLRTAYDPEGLWSAPVQVKFIGKTQTAGFVPWHINVIKTEHAFYAVICMKNYTVPGQRNQLYLATSTDGSKFRLQSLPILRPTESDDCWDAGALYQASIIPVAGKKHEAFKMYYSAYSKTYPKVWKTGFSYIFAY